MVSNFLKKISLGHILLIAFFLRLILLPWTYHGDVTVTYWWGKFASEFGWRGYYDWLNFGGYGRPDQPMLNIYFDWFIRQTYLFIYSILWYINTHVPLFPSKLMQWYFENGNQVLLKFPMILADIIIIKIIYSFSQKLFGQNKSKLIALILALNLPLIYNSAVWGSGDSIINLFALLSINYLWNKKYTLASIMFITSILYKSSLLIWIPIMIVVLIKNKPNLKQLLIPLLLSCTYIYIICFPFVPLHVNVFFWFYQTMTLKILPGAMAQITVNAMNFWAIIFNLLPQQLDNKLFLFSINYRQISLFICLIFYIMICVNLYKNFNIKNLLLGLVNITLITFMFMTRMHERYTFPALIPLLILCFYDKKYLKYYVLISITHLLNVYNWWFTPFISPIVYLLKQNYFIKLISITNLVVMIQLFRFSFQNNPDHNQIRHHINQRQK